eukprot:m.108457 g.108457  ORF g.108457 m.108457 type:complete len:484 (-) comp9259_c2_seq1:35-1486(-)
MTYWTANSRLGTKSGGWRANLPGPPAQPWKGGCTRHNQAAIMGGNQSTPSPTPSGPSELVVMRDALLDMEFHLLYKASDDDWKEKRGKWRNGVRESVVWQNFGIDLLLLEANTKYSAQAPCWGKMRERWIKYCKDVTTKEEAASALLALERSISTPFFNAEWGQRRNSWALPLFGLGGTYKNVPFPEAEATITTPTGTVVFSTKPLGSGASRHAYKGSVTKGHVESFSAGCSVVVKVIQAKAFNQGMRLSDSDIEAQELARKYADDFNKSCKLNKKLYFRIPKLVRSPRAVYNEAGTCIIAPNERMLLEVCIHGEYEKFNNNIGWSAGESSLPDFFSHWSFHASNGAHLVCDLQGHKSRPGGPKYGDEEHYYLMTDPVVLSHEVGRFGDTDLGVGGMVQFLRNHHCNDLCKSTGLPPVGRMMRARIKGLQQGTLGDLSLARLAGKTNKATSATFFHADMHEIMQMGNHGPIIDYVRQLACATA